MPAILGCKNRDCLVRDTRQCARAAELPGPPLTHCPDILLGPTEARTSSGQQSSQALEPSPADAIVGRPLTAAHRHSHAVAVRPSVSRKEPPTSRQSPAPWMGRQLSSTEVNGLLWRSPARVFALLGAYDAGKTCLLTSFFLQLANRQYAGFPYRFASSRSLVALHDLAERAAAWEGHPDDEIVAHTPKEQEAVSFLHLGVCPRDSDDARHLDLLFTDLPGEWATTWSQLQDDETQKRMAFLSRCDGVLVLQDAASALSSNRPDAECSRLIRRLIDLHKDQAATDQQEGRMPRARTLGLVLSKLDRVLETIQHPPPVEQRLERDAWGPLGKRLTRTWAALKEAQTAGLKVDVFPVSAFPRALASGQPVGVMAPFRFLLEHADARPRWTACTPPPSEPPFDRPFLAMRRWEAP